jgi:hypothetical protein
MGYFIFILSCFIAFSLGQAVGLMKAQIRAKEYVNARKYSLRHSSSDGGFKEGHIAGMEAVVNELYGYKVRWDDEHGPRTTD